ncbi:putative Ig domain-containing protein [Plectonema radiosum NIES-515]|uniref:Ig domain-containing protein n=1 Tax=Plectonema radiosum NIES-515 TaxID=2986073 RepID=A0ABT3B6W9_9CYAN|nr:putative Ig domain-containing protein [Plectonema radiosum]MCV3217133.1 putative Ig domain-containing protein [Plectonema radiosum NIES-515]
MKTRGEGVGNYKFRLLNRADSLAKNLDTDIIGQFDNDNLGTTGYRITIPTGGKYVYIDGQAGSYDYWKLYSSNGKLVTSNYIDYDQEKFLTEGEYWLLMQGNGSSDPNYNVRVVTSETPQPEVITYGETVSKTITKKGSYHTYTFAGEAGQQLFYDALGGDEFDLRIYDPTGRNLFFYDYYGNPYGVDSRNDYDSNDERLVLTTSGTYRVEVKTEAEGIGDYKFRLLEKTSAIPTITFNTDYTDSFDNNGTGAKLFRFLATTGQHFYLDTVTDQNHYTWTLYTPNGQTINSATVQNGYLSDYKFDAAVTGEYLLSVQGFAADPSNQQKYKFNLVTPASSNQPLTLGNTVNGSLTTGGQENTYTFIGVTGQKLFFDALAGDGNLKAQLYSPSNALVFEQTTNSDRSPFTLSESGSYRLVIIGEQPANKGNYSFILSDRSTAPTIQIGTPISGNLNPGNKVNLYQFTAKSGQSLKFDLDADTWSGANWILYDPSGTIFKAPSANIPDFNVTFGASGLYTLAIAGNSDTRVDYSFKVTDTSVTPVTNTGLGAVQSGRLNVGQVIDYNFTATAGTLILLDSQDNSNSEIRNRLINLDGTLVFTDSDSRYDTAPILLEQTGNYKLQTFGYYDSTAGDYKFNLLELPRSFRSPNLNYLEIGSVVSGNLNALQDKAYTFDGVHGQKFMFNAMIGENVRASLYDPNGNNIFSTSNFQWNGDRGLFTLTTDGLYYLVIANDEAASRNYSFQLLDTTVAPDITYSLPKAGSLDNGQQSQFFKLQANVGDRLYFDSLTDSIPDGNYRWKLFDPGNNQLFDTEQRYDSEILIPETGEYYLYIQGGSGTDKVDYNFRVLRHEKVVSDVITPGTGENASNSGKAQGLFNVKLSAKDALGASTVQDFNLKLLPDPDNGNPVIITTPKTRFALADKVYQYKLKSVDPDGDKLTYRLLSAPLGALIDNETGELLWFPEFTVTAGSQVNFQVEVNDRRGGKDIQSFAVDVYNNLGKIQGAVFDDLNSNGLLDSKLVKGDNPAIVFAIDVSGSTAAPFFGEEGNKTTKTVLSAQVAAANAMIDAVVASGGGSRIKFGIIPHKFNAVIQDMDLATEGLQIYTTANADTNGNGIADIREILSSYTPDGSNNFTTALQTIDSLFDALPGTPNLIFMSDGYGPLDPTIANQVVTDIKAKGGNVTAFGVGLYSTIETIQKIDPNAERITDFEKLLDVFSGFDDRYALEPFKENVTVYLDLNNNGILDQGEPNQLTKKDTSTSTLGKNRYYYTFDDLLPGTYTVRTVVPNGYTLTTPTSGAKVDTITLDGEDFIHLAGLGKVSEPVNVDPVFITTPDKSKVKAGENLIYRAIATDANADPLNYDLILAPPGMTVDKTTGTVVWSPSKQIIEQYYAELRAERERLTALGRGEFARNTVELNVGLRVRDGKGGQALQYINVELLPDNIAPVFTSVSKNNKAQVDKTFRYQATALNTDGDVLVYSKGDGALDGLSVTNTGLVTWTPNSTQQGLQEFTIKVTDGKGGEALQRVSVVVGANLPNTAPDITSTPRTVVRLGNTYLYKVEANDVDGDVLTYSLVTKPTGMDITQDGVISWTPTAAQFGNYTLSVDVSDGTLTTTQDFTLNVTNFATNNTPTITSTPNLVTNLERTYEYNLTGTDPDNDLLLWSLDSSPEGMVIDATTGVLRWQPKSTQIQEHTVAVRATDAYGAYVGQEFTLTVRGINTPPAIVSNPVTSAAQNQVYTYNVVATDIENDGVTYSLGRRPVGMTINTEGKVEWKPSSSQIGSHIVEAIARDSQGATSTQSFTIEVGTTAINNAPSITSTPKFVASVGSPYQYQVVATDPDTGDTLTYQILSKPSGVDIQINPTTGLLTWASPAAGQYQIVVGAVDSFGLGAAQRFTLTAPLNNNPVINSTAPNTVTPGSTYAYDVKATDADGDNLTYNLDSASLGKGITVDALGRLRWNPTTTNVGNNTINVTVNDGNGGSATQTINLNVAQDTVAPSLRLIALNNTANLGSDITFQARATDNVKVASLQLTVDGTPVVLDANGIVTVKASRSGTISAVAIATDTSGNTKQETFDVLVIDSTDVEAPTVSFQLEGINDGDFVKSPTSIRATITDDGSLDYYRLLVAPVNGGEFKELWRNDNPTAINNGLLVEKFDPSLLQNDSYIVRLEVADNGGKISYFEQVVDVAGDLKLGNFRLSFTDLTVPVTGIPITLTRTYDTLTSNTTDDFGYGWRMEFRDTDLRTSLRKPDELQQELGVQNAFRDGTRVYITLPGGKREAFTFKPKQVEEIDGTPLLYFSKYFYTPEFIADKGVTSTLTVDSQFITLNRNSNEFMGFAGNGYNPADQYFGGKYILTTKEGIKYEIDALSGDLLTVTDTNGNKLTYTDDAIASSTGQKITFERDASGRIKSVKDPMGELIRYEYDAQGDLVSVSDREGNTTRMEYDQERKHYLDKIIDPLGRTGVRNEYGEDGRLKELVDVNGQKVEMSYDPNNSRQVVKDQLGNATIYEYDDRGNILTEIDAEGQITKRKYDENNNVLEETVISDRSGESGFTTKSTYDSRNNKLTETDALGNITYYTYGDKSRLLTVTDSLGRTTTNKYDGSGNLTSTIDATGKISTYEYDISGQLKSVKDANGKLTSFEYTKYGDVRQITDALNNVTDYVYNIKGDKLSEKRYMTLENGQVRELLTTWAYDSKGQMKTMTDAENHTTTYEYDDNGKQTAVIDALNRRTEYVYNTKGELIETIYADDTPNDLTDNLRSINRYDEKGQKVASIDFGGRETRFVYDKVGRLIETILPDSTPNNWDDNARTKEEYYTDGFVKAQIDERGNRTEFRYDAAGRQIEIIYVDDTPATLTDNPRTKYVYDAAGQRIVEVDALNRTTSFKYDDLGRLVKTEFQDKTFTSQEYDNLGRRVATIDQNGKRTEYGYDDLGRLIGVKNALNDWTTYAYNSVGNLITITDALNHTTRYEYDGLGRRTATILPMNQRAEMTYDAVGNLKTNTDFNGRTITYNYDSMNWMSGKQFQDESKVTYAYNSVGLQDIVKFVDASGVTTATYDYDYDVRDRQIKRTDNIGGVSRSISYTYDVAGNRTSVTTASSTINYTFDVRNRLDKVIEDGIVTADYDYDAVSNLISTTFVNGTQEVRQYDDLNRLKYLENQKGNNILSSYTYTLDKAGNRKKVVENTGRVVDYIYDGLYRLTEEKITNVVNGNRVYDYTYDKVGNRKIKTEVANGNTTTTSYEYDANDRLLNEKVNNIVTVSYGYDNNGSTLTKTDSQGTTSYVWNDEKRLIQATVNGTQVKYAYNDQGIRVSSSVNGVETQYLLDEGLLANVWEEYRPDGMVLVEYAYGRDLVNQTQGNQTTYYHVDGLGSTRVLTDASGVIVNTYDYEAYGELINSPGEVENKYLFAGEQYDSALGDYYNRARYYDADTGRFTRKDNYEGRLGESITLHKYTYAHDNPVSLTDPTGFASQSPTELSKYGQAVEPVIQTQYENDPDFLGDSIYFGVDTSIGCGVGKNKLLCPDILNYDKQHYMEIKPFTASGRKAASESMGRYKASLQPGYMPCNYWKAIPDVGMGIALNVPFIYFNDDGVLFYTTRTHLYDAVIALAALKAGKRRSQLKKWREGAEPDLLPSPTFQASPVGYTISDYILQSTAMLVALVAVSSLTRGYA